MDIIGLPSKMFFLRAGGLQADVEEGNLALDDYQYDSGDIVS